MPNYGRPPKLPVELPPSFEVTEDSNRLVIAWGRSRRPAFWTLALGAGMVLSPWIVGGIDPTWRLMSLCGIPLGLLIAYWGLVATFNTRSVVVDRQHLRRLNGPLPTLTTLTIPSGEVDQVYVQTRVLQSRRDRGGHITSVSYQARVRLRSGRDVRLISGLDTRQQARFIEQELEHWLGINDRRVDGEG